MNKGVGGHARAYRGATDDWLTPPNIIQALGEINLDPCAAPDPKPWATASIHYTAPAQDGLSLPWSGFVFVNPPYGPATGTWLARLAEHGRGIALTFARTETRMFRDHVWRKADSLLFLFGRPHFHRPDGSRATGNSGGPVVLIAYGAEAVQRLELSGLDGHVVYLRKESS